jgi:8-oxo-dGTP diphosphatase
LQYSIRFLRSRIALSDLARHLLPEKFTLTDLQKVHEIILGDVVDKRNFRKKILSLDLIAETGETQKKGVMRPAALYTFK